MTISQTANVFMRAANDSAALRTGWLLKRDQRWENSGDAKYAVLALSDAMSPGLEPFRLKILQIRIKMEKPRG